MGTNECQPYGPKLNLQGFEVLDELGYLIRIFPMDCIHIVIIPATNQAGSRRKSFKNLSLEELMKFLGLMYAMGIVKMANWRMYWDTSLSDSSLFPNMNFSKYMSRHRFENILYDSFNFHLTLIRINRSWNFFQQLMITCSRPLLLEI